MLAFLLDNFASKVILTEKQPEGEQSGETMVLDKKINITCKGMQ